MSYQGFNWSPYFDHVADHQRRNQQSEANESYQRQPYQPSATHTASASSPPLQEYSSAPQNSAERNPNSHSSRYAPIGSESTRTPSQDYYDSRRLPPYTAAQASINTTAMGNLVYASSLAQEQRTDTTQARYGSMQHIVDYNRYPQPTSSVGAAGYGLTSTASNGYEQRSDSRGPGIAREEYKPPDSQKNYSASNTNASTNLNSERYNRSYVRPSSRDNSKASHFASTPHQSDSTLSIHAHPKPPASDKNSKISHSRPAISNQSPHSRNPQSTMGDGTVARKVSNQRHQTAKEPPHAEPSTSHQVASDTQGRSVNPEQSTHSLQRSLPYLQHEGQPRESRPREGQPREGQPREGHPQSNHNNGSSRETEAQNQTTVDPSQIFNHYEFQKRQATAETARKAAEAAEAARKAAEEAAAKVTKPAHFATPAPASAPVPAPAPAPASGGEDSAAIRKDQMELEMMQMIEKMRDYKAKDPALFSQIWEQVKKGQPATTNQTQPANRSISQASTSAPNNKDNSIAEITENVPLLSPTPLQVPLEPESSVGLKEKAPDLGKFPFQRRKPSRKSILAATDLSMRSTISSGNVSSGNISNSNGNILSKNVHSNASSSLGSTTSAPAPAPANSNQKDSNHKDVNHKDVNQNMISQPQQTRLPPQIVHVRGVGPQIPQDLTTPQQASKTGTIWPEGNKKWTLAEAARRALTSGSVNAGRAISVNEIVNLLDQNPSYTELCEKLELRGFIIDRGHFARLLLLAVSGAGADIPPQQQNSHTQMKTTGSNGSIGWHGQGMLQPGPLHPRPLHPHNVPEMRNQQHHGFGMLVKTPIRSHGLPPASEIISRSSIRNKQAPVPHQHPLASIPALLPSSKKEMAKKRTFAEIIDLTQHVSDEDDQHENVDSDPSVKLRNGNNATKFQNPHPLRSEINSVPVTDEDNMDLSKFKYALSQRDLLQSETIIRPMNKRNDALRRDSYNAKTIARDILVASGKHPTMASLNYHLEILRKKFRHVDNNSDLTTFKWDLVDPGEPTKTTDDVTNDADDEGAPLNEVNRGDQSLLSRGTQIATATDGDDVVMIDVNIHQPVKSLPSLRNWKPSRSSMEGIQRTSVQDPYEGENEGEMSFQRTPIAVSHHDVPNPHTPPSRPRGRPPGSGKKHKDGRNKVNSPSQPPSEPPPSEPSSQPPGPRRRGRPPGSKDSAPRKSATRSPHTGISTEPRSSTGPLRQSGLRNAVTSSDGFAVVIDSRLSATAQEQDKRGTLEPKKPKLIRRDGVVHKVYKCRWNECPYELHNLQLLRKHVYKHREQYGEGPFPCCWADCGTINLSKEDTDDIDLIPLEFNTASAWETHIDAKHLDMIAWNMGDGPCSSDAEASDYLSDAQGRQMTPVARTTGPSDTLSLTSGKETTEEYHKIHQNKTDRDKAKALFESLKEKKSAQGGMARSGSKVITKDMADKATARSGFMTVPPEEL